jgi:hypothetical protein
MRKSVLGAVMALSMAVAGGGALIAYGQPAPAPAAGPAPNGPSVTAPQPPAGGAWMQWRRPGWRTGMMRHHWMRMRTFALFFRPADRQLTPPDVQKIAEAFLLWNGNHTWKVIDVAPTTDGVIGFSLATQDGSVIAKFTMDPHSGRIHRIG